MKANELMIGDWVKIKGHLDYDKVQEIARDESMQWYISFACSATLFRAYEFEPIPLTPEILEKNGFVFRGDNSTMYGEYYLHNQSTFAIKMFNGYLVGMCMGEDLEFHYVHEFQHALRLCGLDKLADNFKV